MRRSNSIVSDRIKRSKTHLEAGIAKLLEGANLPSGQLLALSGASGAHAATAAEKAALESLSGIAVRGFGSRTGHLKEAQFPFAVALAAMAVQRGSGYPAFDSAVEKAYAGAPEQALATAIGYHVFEGAALLSRAA